MVEFLEDRFARIGEQCIDRVMGCLADAPDLLANWEKEHRQEGERDR